MGLTSTPPTSLEQCVPKEYCLLREQKTKEYIDLKVSKVEEKMASEISELYSYVDDEIEGTYKHRQIVLKELHDDMANLNSQILDLQKQIISAIVASSLATIGAIVTLVVVIKFP